MTQEKPEENEQAHPADESMLTEQKEGHVSEPGFDVQKCIGCLFFPIIFIILFLVFDTFAIIAFLLVVQSFSLIGKYIFPFIIGWLVWSILFNVIFKIKMSIGIQFAIFSLCFIVICNVLSHWR